MLFKVEKPNIKVLTHVYNPTAEVNGYKQMGKFTRVAKPSPGLGDIPPGAKVNPFTTGTPQSLPPSPESGVRIDQINTGFKTDASGAIILNYVPLSMRSSTPLQSAALSAAPPIVYGTGFVRESFIPSMGGVSSEVTKGRIISSGDPYYFKRKGRLDEEEGLSGWKPFRKPFGDKGSPIRKFVTRVAAVNVGGMVGAASGFVTGGPAGVIPGAIAGGIKAAVDVTKTGKPSITTKTAYQSAAYGAGAGLVRRAVSTGIEKYQTYQKSQGATKALQSSSFAREEAIRMGTYVPQAAPKTLLAKFAAGMKAAAPYSALALLAPGSPPAPEPAPEGGGEGSSINIVIPGGSITPPTDGSYPVGYGTPSGGEGGAGGLPALSPSPDAGSGAEGLIKKNLPVLAGVGILTFFMFRKVKLG